MSFASVNRMLSVSDQQQYRLIYAATLPFFLVATLVGRAARHLAGRQTPSGTPPSLVAEARAAGSNAVMFAFLG
jgi:hypothetical protein